MKKKKTKKVLPGESNPSPSPPNQHVTVRPFNIIASILKFIIIGAPNYKNIKGKVN